MGLFDFVKNAGAKIFDRAPDRDDDRDDVVKPMSQHLREHGIDPAGIRYRFVGGTLVVEGTVPDQDTREKAILVLGNIDGVDRVDDRLTVGKSATFANVKGGASSNSFGNVQASGSSTAPAPAGGGTQDVGHASAGSGGGWTSTTYTVQKGDTLSKIAKETLGDANRYPEIFEANKPMLKDPDRIYPGQVLRIPKRLTTPTRAR